MTLTECQIYNNGRIIKIFIEESNDDLRKIRHLISVLEKYDLYEHFDKIYSELEKEVKVAYVKFQRFKTYRRLENFLQAANFRDMVLKEYKEINIEEIKNTLQNSERFINKKYLDFVTLLNIEFIIMDGVANNLEQAIAIYENKENN